MNFDEQIMSRALQLASLGGVAAAPNPLVGAVIVHDGKIIGEGYHQKCGEAHAEVNAVAAVSDLSLLSNSTIYVTLEPCAHFGKTPPCAELLVKHQFKRVVVATVDPFAKVAGKGLEILQKAGIETTVGVLEKEAQYKNRRFFTFHNEQRPYVILKWAETKDGFIDADRNNNETGEIRWISAPETQVLTHQWRTQEQAILVGWKTVLNDNPSLTARAFHGANPLRIVIDPHLKAPTSATLFSDSLPTIVFNAQKTEHVGAVRYEKLADFSISNVLHKLYELNQLSVIIEGGKYTLEQFISANLWDEARVIQGKSQFSSGTPAPKINQLPNQNMPFGDDTIYTYFRS